MFCFCLTHLCLLFGRRHPTVGSALSDRESNAVCPVAVLYLDMVLSISLKSLRLLNQLTRAVLIMNVGWTDFQLVAMG